MDGNLRKLFQSHLPQVHWQSIESGMTGRGIPDLNGCHEASEFWIECKLTKHWSVSIRPEQIAWLSRRCRVGGRAFVAVRRTATGTAKPAVRPPSGPWQTGTGGHTAGEALAGVLGTSREETRLADELWLFGGREAVTLKAEGLKGTAPLGVWAGGPTRWNWPVILAVLLDRSAQ